MEFSIFNVKVKIKKRGTKIAIIFFLKDTLKAFDDFKNKQQKCMKFLDM